MSHQNTLKDRAILKFNIFCSSNKHDTNSNATVENYQLFAEVWLLSTTLLPSVKTSYLSLLSQKNVAKDSLTH